MEKLDWWMLLQLERSKKCFIAQWETTEINDDLNEGDKLNFIIMISHIRAHGSKNKLAFSIKR